MSVLVKGLGMDFVRQQRTEMAITGIWPAVVSILAPCHDLGQYHIQRGRRLMQARLTFA